MEESRPESVRCGEVFVCVLINALIFGVVAKQNGYPHTSLPPHIMHFLAGPNVKFEEIIYNTFGYGRILLIKFF